MPYFMKSPIFSWLYCRKQKVSCVRISCRAKVCSRALRYLIGWMPRNLRSDALPLLHVAPNAVKILVVVLRKTKPRVLGQGIKLNVLKRLDPQKCQHTKEKSV